MATLFYNKETKIEDIDAISVIYVCVLQEIIKLMKMYVFNKSCN